MGVSSILKAVLLNIKGVYETDDCKGHVEIGDGYIKLIDYDYSDGLLNIPDYVNCFNLLKPLNVDVLTVRGGNGLVVLTDLLSELHCKKLILDTELKNANYLRRMFRFCKSLEEIEFRRQVGNEVSSMEEMFFNCVSLKKLDLSKISISSSLTLDGAFKNCSNLDSVILPTFDGVANLTYAFTDCSKLKNVEFKGNLKLVTFKCIFHSCPSLKYISFKNVDLSNVSARLFVNCKYLEYIEVGNQENMTTLESVIFENMVLVPTYIDFTDYKGIVLITSSFSKYSSVNSSSINSSAINLYKLLYNGEIIGTRLYIKDKFFDCQIVINKYKNNKVINMVMKDGMLVNSKEYKRKSFVPEISKKEFFEKLGSLRNYIKEV